MGPKIPIKLKLPDNFLDEEERCGYLISTEKKALWAVELDLLAELDRVCKKNNVKYFACAGTMLGAIRHGGIIPWDDDIDVMLFRSDYIKLCKIANQEFQYPYFFQTEYKDPGSMRGHAQLRNSKTTAILASEEKYNLKINQGIFIDIFPLDNVPDLTAERENFFKKLNKIKYKAFHFAFITYRYYPEQSNSIKNILKNFRHFFMMTINILSRGNRLYKKYEKTMQSYNNITTSHAGILALYDQTERFIWDKTDLNSQIIDFQFEMLKIPIQKNYKNILAKTYGKWDIFQRNNAVHGSLKYNPYESYKTKTKQLFQ